MDMGIIYGLMIFLGATFLVTPKIGLNVFGIYYEEKTTKEDLKKARIIGGVVLVVGLVGMYFLP
jgi:hypothetical protein